MKLLFASAAAIALFSTEFFQNVVATSSSAKLQNILKNTDKSPAYDYPTDLTRDIIPVCLQPFCLSINNRANG